MTSAGMLPILFLVTYVLVAFSLLTGLLKFIFKSNEILNILHKMAGPLINALFLVAFLFASFSKMPAIPRIIITFLFILLVYTGLVTGIRKDKPWIIVTHRIMGIVSFALFTMLLIIFVMK